MNAKQTERELEKIEKEKRSLMMKELIYAQKERMYKHEIKINTSFGQQKQI